MFDLSVLGASSLGIWTRADALVLLSPAQVDGFVRRGDWQVVWRGVYADAGHVLDVEQRALAAVLAAGGDVAERSGDSPPPLLAVAAGRTAARVWRIPLVDDHDPATDAWEHLLDDVAVRRHVNARQHAGRTLRPRELSLQPDDVVRHESGLWLTGPLRTLVDCADLLEPDALVCALDDVLHRELVTADELEAAVAVRRGDRSAPALRTAVSLSDGRAESPSETLARLILKPALPDLVPQVELYDETGGLLARFDLGDERVRLAVEADGRRGHAGEEMVAKDRRRDWRSSQRGWWTERATWYDVRRRQRELRWRVVSKHIELSRGMRPAA